MKVIKKHLKEKSKKQKKEPSVLVESTNVKKDTLKGSKELIKKLKPNDKIVMLKSVRESSKGNTAASSPKQSRVLTPDNIVDGPLEL